MYKRKTNGVPDITAEPNINTNKIIGEKNKSTLNKVNGSDIPLLLSPTLFTWGFITGLVEFILIYNKKRLKDEPYAK